jgi:hypothetical protein
MHISRSGAIASAKAAYSRINPKERCCFVEAAVWWGISQKIYLEHFYLYISERIQINETILIKETIHINDGYAKREV